MDRQTILQNHPTLNQYQILSQATAIYPGQGEFQGFCYILFKLAGETGEILEKMGKLLRDHGIEWGTPLKDWPEEVRIGMKKEFGDVLWYIAGGLKELGFTLQECGETNLAKLESRYNRGVIHGSGDER
jgi:NTP pyrophosphatase (non-canonical NTP hydrolase)